MESGLRRMTLAGAVGALTLFATALLVGSGSAATEAAPTNTQPPTIGGTPEVGKTLTAREGTWTGDPTDYDYAWRRCDADGGSCLLINDAETKMLAGEKSLPRAARKVLSMGPQALVVKHGEYGATIFFKEGAFGIGSHPFRAPALPIEEVKDPTGAGDSFAGGFMGYIASQGALNREVLKRALFYGGVLGSFAVEEFGTERLQNLTRAEIDARFQIFRELTHLG